MKRIAMTGLVLLGSLVSFNSMAQMSAEDAQAAKNKRQAVFELLSFANAPMGAMARGGDFDGELVAKNLDRIIMLAGMIPETFEADTRGSGVQTRAADTIWDNQADFAALANDLAAGAQAAKDILASQGAGGLRQAVAQVGPKCGACHDRFRLD